MSSGNMANWQQRITVDPDVLVGKPVINGTRISVELVIDLLASGSSVDEIVRNYPRLTQDDILACLRYVESVM
jgi:uncharacterized protein (DUF433 family)